MGHMNTYMVHVPLHVFWLILHGTLPKCYWGLLSLIMLIRRSTWCFKWYFWIFEHLAKCTNGHCRCLWCSDVSQSGLCTHNTYYNFTSIWHFDIFFNLNHLSPSQGYFIGILAFVALISCKLCKLNFLCKSSEILAFHSLDFK